MGSPLTSGLRVRPVVGSDHPKTDAAMALIRGHLSDAVSEALFRIRCMQEPDVFDPSILDELNRDFIAPQPRPAPVVMFGVPLYGREIPIEFSHSKDLLDMSGCHILFRPQGGTHQAACREALAEAAIAGGCSHLFMTDADMVYPPDTLQKLLAADVDVICGFAIWRAVPHCPVFGLREKAYHYRTQYPTDTGTMLGKRLPGVQRSYVIGGAGLLIKTDALRRIPRPWFSFDAKSEDGKGVGEDVYFSEKCHEAGVATWVHTDVCVGHLTTVVMTPVWVEETGRWDVNLGNLHPFMDPQPPEGTPERAIQDGRIPVIGAPHQD